MNVGRIAAMVVSLALLGSCTTSTTGGSPSAGASTTAVRTSAASATTTSAAPATGASAAKTSTTAATTTAPPSAAATTSGPWTLSINGLGPLIIGTKVSALEKLGYFDPGTDVCPQKTSSKKLQDEGVYLYPSGDGANAVLAEVGLTKATYATVSGARVGDTMLKLKQLYGSQLKIETKNGNGGPFKVANVRIGAREVVFSFPWESKMVDTDKVQVIVARNWSADMFGEC